MKSTGQRLSGWGNYPVECCYVTRPESLERLSAIITSGDRPNYIPRGLGRSYGDSALNRDSGVVIQTGLNRFLRFDEQKGVLECESGVSIAEIIEHFLPRGWFVPTTPGTQYVTVGGAIAADVHGKNHHRDGSFGNFVLDLKLLTASGEIVACSPMENSDVFWATVGGMGLTGIIITARIRLVKIETSLFDVTFRRTTNLDETLEYLMTVDQDYRYTVAWVDCLALGKSLGRSVLMFANNAKIGDLPSRLCDSLLTVPTRDKKSIPFPLPQFLLNTYTVKAFNCLYYASTKNGRKFLNYDTFFYPLDSVHNWNQVYGRRGFVQYQALFPLGTSRGGLVELLEKISQSGKASFLAVLKTSGRASQGMLSYLYPGHTLALDFPDFGEGLRQLVRELDEVLLKYGGRLYLAKDAMMTRETFAAMYPNLRKFKEVKAKIDPNNRFVSSQARRVGIVEAA